MRQIPLHLPLDLREWGSLGKLELYGEGLPRKIAAPCWEGLPGNDVFFGKAELKEARRNPMSPTKGQNRETGFFLRFLFEGLFLGEALFALVPLVGRCAMEGFLIS
jgi:hypothetical protein